jgi:transcriptional regulator with XRE-family HTH domain
MRLVKSERCQCVHCQEYGYCWLPRLEEVRIGKGWSIGSLAQAVNVSYDYLAAVENGRHRTRNILARRLADVLEVSVSELEGDEA